VKPYPHYLIALVIVSVQITLLALILGGVQDHLIPLVAGLVLIVLIVVVTVVVISGRTTGISAIFSAIGSGVATILQALSHIRTPSSSQPGQAAIVVDVSRDET
jgi:hypothetical protein